MEKTQAEVSPDVLCCDCGCIIEGGSGGCISGCGECGKKKEGKDDKV